MVLQNLQKILLGSFILEDHEELETLLTKLYRESQVKSNYGWIETNLSVSATFQMIKEKSPQEKRALVLELVTALQQLKVRLAQRRSYSPNDPIAKLHQAGMLLLDRLMRQKLALRDEDFIFLFESYTQYSDRPYYYFGSWPVTHTAIQLEKFAKKHSLHPTLQSFLALFIYQADFDQQHSYWGSNLVQVKRSIETVLHRARPNASPFPPFSLNEKDAFGLFVNQTLHSFSKRVRQGYDELLHRTAKASGSQPSQSYRKAVQTVIKVIGKEHFKETVESWLAFIVGMDENEQVHRQYWQGQTYTYTTRTFLQPQNSAIAKGLVWSLVPVSDRATLLLLAQLAERAYRKIPGVGPASVAVGNACLYVLAQSQDTHGIGHLACLQRKVQQPSIRRRIQRYIDEASAKRGISSHELEKIAAPLRLTISPSVQHQQS